MPLIYPIVIVEFALNPRDIGLFIAITTAVGGSMQLLYGFLTRWVPRPALLGGGQLIFGPGLLVSGLDAFAGAAARPRSPLRGSGSSPQHPIGNALLSDSIRRSVAGSRSAPTSAAATWGRCWCRSSGWR